MDEQQFPHVPLALLEALERAYPDTMPDPNLSLDGIRLAQGAVGVVRFLRWVYEEQDK